MLALQRSLSPQNTSILICFFTQVIVTKLDDGNLFWMMIVSTWRMISTTTLRENNSLQQHFNPHESKISAVVFRWSFFTEQVARAQLFKHGYDSQLCSSAVKFDRQGRTTRFYLFEISTTFIDSRVRRLYPPRLSWNVLRNDFNLYQEEAATSVDSGVNYTTPTRRNSLLPCL